jgi:cobalt-zinc-cadmium efflux system outer membrane protein
MPGAAALEGAALDGRHPELALASQSTELARKRVDLMRHSRRDAPELTLGVRQDVPGRAEASQGSLVVGLRLPFGTDDRNRPLRSGGAVRAGRRPDPRAALRERLDSDIAAARARSDRPRRSSTPRPPAPGCCANAPALIDKSFRAGETPLPDLLRALAAAAQADSAVARQTAALGLARARLQQALGLLP